MEFVEGASESESSDMSQRHQVGLILEIHHTGTSIIIDLQNCGWSSPAMSTSIISEDFYLLESPLLASSVA